MKKRTWIVLLSFLLLTGCGAKPQEPDTGAGTELGTETETGTESEKEDAAVSMYDLRVAMEGADTGFPSMLNASSVEENAEENFKYISKDLDYSKIESFFVSYSEDGEYADEIVVIVMKDRADMKEAENCLKKHRENRYKLYEQYQPREMKRVEDGLAFTSGRYAVLIISDNRDAVKKAFEQVVNGN